MLLAAAICIGGCLLMIYKGPSKTYRDEFDAKLNTWVEEHTPGGLRQ